MSQLGHGRGGSFRWLHVVLLAQLGWVGLAACSSRDERRAQHEARARAYLAEQKYPEAKIELLNWVQLAAGDAQAHLELAEVHGRLGEYVDALAQYREAVRLAPEHHDWQVRLAALELAVGRVPQAKDAADSVLQADPQNVQALVVRGSARGRLGDAKGRLADLRTARELAPDDVGVLLALGRALWEQGVAADAELVLRRAAELDSSTAAPLAFASFLADRGRGGEARAFLQESLRRTNSSADQVQLQIAIANVELGQGDAAAGERILSSALAANPDDVELLLRLARVYIFRGEPARAEPLLLQAVERQSGQAKPLLTLASFYQSRGDLTQALAAVDRARALAPDSDEARLLRAEYLMELRATNPTYEPEARELLTGVLRARPQNVRAQFTAAKFAFIDGDLQRAVTLLGRVADAEPVAAAYLLRGRAQAGLGLADRAREDFRQALQLDPTNAAARRELAALDLGRGQPESALEAVDLLLKVAPDDPSNVLLRAQILRALDRPKDALSALNALNPVELSRQRAWVLQAAELFAQLGVLPKARALHAALLSVNPADFDAVQAAVRLELRSDKPSQARALLDRALAASPDSPGLLALRGTLAVERMTAGKSTPTDSAVAEADLRRALELDPARLDARIALARFERVRGHVDAALAAYEDACQRQPRRADVLLEIGSYLGSLRRHDAARERFEKVLSFEPGNVWAKNNLAWTLASLDAPDGAVLQRAQVLAQEAVDAEPDQPAFKDTLGYVMLRRDRTRAATSAFRDALAAFKESSPERAMTRYHLALSHERNGELDRAREEVEQALSEAAVFPEREDALALRERLRLRNASAGR